MTWPTVPLEAQCTTCGKCHGTPMCAPRLPVSTRPPLSDKPLCKHGERDRDELPHSVLNDVTHVWDYCPAVPRG